mmetsp:Transcript_30304/g.65004  ORF Transcript_30304/g.65004 Transcript_30304/m.65004 type:complete len:168 (-) Transcript_30304:576-1079(-)
MCSCLSSRDRILKSVDKLVEKEKMTREIADDALGKIEFTTDANALRDVDFIVEAVVENIDLKEALYTTLGELCKQETIFASNTSSLSIGGACVLACFRVCGLLSVCRGICGCMCGPEIEFGNLHAHRQSRPRPRKYPDCSVPLRLFFQPQTPHEKKNLFALFWSILG